ncbi:unnamed protein product, partial [Ranitomeya imitator]
VPPHIGVYGEAASTGSSTHWGLRGGGLHRFLRTSGSTGRRPQRFLCTLGSTWRRPQQVPPHIGVYGEAASTGSSAHQGLRGGGPQQVPPHIGVYGEAASTGSSAHRGLRGGGINRFLRTSGSTGGGGLNRFLCTLGSMGRRRPPQVPPHIGVYGEVTITSLTLSMLLQGGHIIRTVDTMLGVVVVTGDFFGFSFAAVAWVFPETSGVLSVAIMSGAALASVVSLDHVP